VILILSPIPIKKNVYSQLAKLVNSLRKTVIVNFVLNSKMFNQIKSVAQRLNAKPLKSLMQKVYVRNAQLIQDQPKTKRVVKQIWSNLQLLTYKEVTQVSLMDILTLKNSVSTRSLQKE
jgi:hypothetical protein